MLTVKIPSRPFQESVQDHCPVVELHCVSDLERIAWFAGPCVGCLEQGYGRSWLGVISLEISLAHQVPLRFNRATGDFAYHATPETYYWVTLLWHSYAPLHHAEARHDTVSLLFPSHVAPSPHKEWLVGFDITGETSITRIQVQWTGQFVSIERETGLDAQTVTRCQADAL
jgi:hypothetical protein